ncbi:MAG: PKD domain-containing protein [Thermoplasmata archaeon]|nr:MAG: PKD domain-containing protein [Thermoplasmata archaeon]
MFDYQVSAEEGRRRTRRRRMILVAAVVVLILMASLVAVASLDYPELTIQSMSVDRIDITSDTLYFSMYLAVDNTNNVDATLSSVEGEVSSAGKRLDTFYFAENTVIPANTNQTVHFEVRVLNVPLPLPDPLLTVDGSASVRAWVRGITYHFTHYIPLTHSPDLDNQPPVADINAPRFARRDRPAQFDGSNSYDPDGKVVGWTWDFGDGYQMSGKEVEHSFMNQGVYQVSLTVVDQMGERGRTTVEIRVLPL